MRAPLVNLINQTIVFQYSLPNTALGIAKCAHTSDQDHCYKTNNSNNDLVQIIYNGIVDYSYNESNIDISKLTPLHYRALESKLRYHRNAPEDIKVKYGFFGEVLLFLLLYVKYGANTLISRGYFYNPLEASETKGYDSYQLVQKSDGSIELWFGEVKFYESYKEALKKIFSNITKALSNDYLSQNVIAMSDRGQFNISGTPIETIVKAWEETPTINIITELQTHKISLVYPILLAFEDNNKDYDTLIKEVVDHINTKFPSLSYSLGIPAKLFFILLPVSQTNDLKREVIRWIESNQPLI